MARKRSAPKVDKIVGPGNVYVATAKRLVFGAVDIDMIAGPSEIVVVCDGQTDPEWIAMDLFSQAEHDEDAQSVLISLDAAYTAKVRAAIEKLLPGMERRDIIRASLEARGALITAANLDEALALVNRIAPEHLELSLENPEDAARRRAPRRRDFSWAIYRRGGGRLLARTQSRAADLRHRALFLAAGRIRFPEAHQYYPVLGRRCLQSWPHRLRALARRRPDGARPLGGVPDKKD